MTSSSTNLEEYSFFSSDNSPKPEVLYHYTSGEGLKGVIESKSLWATRISYLNDSLEYAFGLNAFKKAIESIISTSGFSGSEEILLSTMKQFCFGDLESINGLAYVISFTKKKDDLHLWRAYCPNNGGYSIGFKLGEEIKSCLHQCIYLDSHEAVEYMKKLITQKLQLLEKLDLESIITTFIWDFATIVTTIKSKGFYSEEEWRFVVPPDQKFSFYFRVNEQLLVPYVKLQLIKNDEDFPNSIIIDSITTHPVMNQSLAIPAVRQLLHKEGYSGELVARVTPSEYSLRNI